MISESELSESFKIFSIAIFGVLLVCLVVFMITILIVDWVGTTLARAFVICMVAIATVAFIFFCFHWARLRV